VQPNISMTFSGDSFDWTFIEVYEPEVHKLNLFEEIGFEMTVLSTNANISGICR
jgi:hypothetical protein